MLVQRSFTDSLDHFIMIRADFIITWYHIS